MKRIVCMVFALSAAICMAKVPVGENVLLNGKLEADQLSFPPYWNARAGTVRYLKNGGPDGLASLRIQPGQRDTIDCRQLGLQTMSNGLYRIRLRYRAQDAVFSKCQIGIAAGRWERFDGINLPGGTCEWKTIEQTVTAIDHPKANTHFIVFYTSGLRKGFVEFADISLSPADERTAEATDKSALVAAARKIRLVPIFPRLDEISSEERTIEFRFFGKLPDGVSVTDCVAFFDFGSVGNVKCPIGTEPMRVSLPETAVSGELTAKVVLKVSGDELFCRVYPYRLKQTVKNADVGTRLNNLCLEVLREKLPPGKSRFAIGSEHLSWYYIRAPGTVTLDGKAVIDDSFACHETFRELTPGEHVLLFDLPRGGEVIVRRISEIFNYCSGVANPFREYGVFDWEFAKRYEIGAVTTHSRPRFAKKETDELRRLGGIVLAWFGSGNLSSADDFVARVERCFAHSSAADYDGATADEQYFAQSDIMTRFADGLWRTRNDKSDRQRRIYSWFVGNPDVEGVDHDTLSAAVNATHGNGKALYEMYLSTRDTEEDAHKFIRERMHETMAKYERFCPGIRPRFGLIFGNFNTTTDITLWTHPQVDYKYYLDMQWNRLANDLAFDGIGVVGHWGTHYADEELHRWSFMLARHYVVEGRTDMLSKSYGLSYYGLVADGDFSEGLKKWDVSSGVESMTIVGLGGRTQNRWGTTEGVGDTCAVFPARSEATVSHVSQRLRGLIPGCWYRLTFCSFNVDDMLARKKRKYLHGVTADVGDGAERDESRSWTNYDHSTHRNRGGSAHCNLHVVMFKATKAETVLTIDNALAKPGDRLGVNFISVNPYLPCEALVDKSATKVIYVDESDISYSSCGMGKRTQVGRTVDGRTFSVCGKRFKRGFGVHPEGALAFRANGKGLSFDALVALDDESTNAVPCRTSKGMGANYAPEAVFKVWADGRIVWKSKEMRPGMKPDKVHIDLDGAKEIILETCSGREWHDFVAVSADWLDARFTCDAETELKVADDPGLFEQQGILTPPSVKEPRINGADIWGVRPNHPVIFRVATSGERPMKFSAAGLPEGVLLDEKGVLRGIAPTKKGNYDIVVDAENAYGRASRRIRLAVGDTIALTPPMGWNSWNTLCYRLTADKVKAAAKAMDDSGLADHGWSYINLDDWWEMNNSGCPRVEMRKSEFGGRDDVTGPARDANGRINPNRSFPDMRGLTDYIHSLGLKAGLYSSPGPLTCGMCEGSYGHELQDADSWAEWGFDYVKYDWCSYRDVFKKETGRGQWDFSAYEDMSIRESYIRPYRLMGECLRRQNRDILYSFCQYGMAHTEQWARKTGANCWRSWDDLKDNWPWMERALESRINGEYHKYAGPGCWVDPDMMIVGQQLSYGFDHPSFLTPNEQYTHVSLWAMVGSPLLIGCDLAAMDAFTKNLLMNDEVIAVSQDRLGKVARRIRHTDAESVWVRPLTGNFMAVALVNRSPIAREIKVSFNELGFEGPCWIKDLWLQKCEGKHAGDYVASVYAHGTKLFKMRPVDCPKCE